MAAKRVSFCSLCESIALKNFYLYTMTPMPEIDAQSKFQGLIQDFSREVLYHRHRLSHQQIDDVLGEHQAKLDWEDKIKRLGDLKVFFELTDQLKAAGIDFLNIKGPLLSQRIYGDPTYRYYKDFDILVARDQVSKVIALFQEMGFVPGEYPWPDKPGRQQDLMEMASHFILLQEERGINVEVHWKLFNQPLVEDKSFDALVLAHVQTLTLSGRAFKVLDNEMELLYLIIHGSKHAWFRLKWLLDVGEFSDRLEIDQEKFMFLVKKLGAETMLALTQGLVSSYLKPEFNPEKLGMLTSPPAPFLLAFAQSRITDQEGKLYDGFTSFLLYLRYKLSLHSSWRYKLALLKLSTLPPAVVNHGWWPLKPIPVIFYKLKSKL
ncbi:hypothetical protein B879_03990 [Cecembia lonarensis LW9]|uniref:Nucleotidyltransferase n=2 Tax=Cecembia TaxID=1187078 RepID=K1LTC0_CECL9|nr:hypothetical protein B879_03990 [Cecembia lonarensis LW9]